MKQKIVLFSFAKTCENEAKQDPFRIILLQSKNLKKLKKRDTLSKKMKN
jgi:hypothetical protein